MKALSEYKKLQNGKLTHEQFYDYVIEKCGRNVDNVIDAIDNEIITKLNEMYSTTPCNLEYYDIGDINVLLDYAYHHMIQREFHTNVSNNTISFLIFMNMLIRKSLESNKSIEHFHIETVDYERGLDIIVELKGVIINGV